jgi:hypothetical protein
LLALVISYRYFNPPQYLLIDSTDRRTEGGDGLRGVEIENAQEILVFKTVIGLQSATGH